MGLGTIAARHLSQYSGGQQQRIFLARAMAQEPLVVILDEPFSGIDKQNREVFHSAIRQFSARGIPVLLATHDLEEASTTCSHIAFVNGELVAFGPTAGTYTPENLRATFGGQVAVFT
jgi:ABC-type Mn2+/Zn2+ transport system ATPase subunit